MNKRNPTGRGILEQALFVAVHKKEGRGDNSKTGDQLIKTLQETGIVSSKGSEERGQKEREEIKRTIRENIEKLHWDLRRKERELERVKQETFKHPAKGEIIEVLEELIEEEEETIRTNMEKLSWKEKKRELERVKQETFKHLDKNKIIGVLEELIEEEKETMKGQMEEHMKPWSIEELEEEWRKVTRKDFKDPEGREEVIREVIEKLIREKRGEPGLVVEEVEKVKKTTETSDLEKYLEKYLQENEGKIREELSRKTKKTGKELEKLVEEVKNLVKEKMLSKI